MAGGTPYRKHYDPDRARHYADAKESDRRGHRAECALVERALRGVPRGESLVDVPCGSGRMTLLIAALGFRPAAADVSPAMVEIARKRFDAEGVEVPVEVQDLEGTSWPDRAFDNVFSFRFFHHLPSDELRAQVARELCRIAGRRVLVSYLDARSWTSRRRGVQARLRGKRPSKHSQHPAAIAALFRAQGFEIEADHARVPLIHSLRVLVARRPGSDRSSNPAR